MAQEDEDEVEVKKVTVPEKETQVFTEEKLEEVDLSTDLQKPRPILISSKLAEEERLELIQLLREFKDIFS